MFSKHIKCKNSDFIVNESLSLSPISSEYNKSYTYVLLQKSGYTTFEAIEMIAKALGINPNSIGFAGLKDEDGYTEQTISIHGKIMNEELLNINFAVEENKFINLRIRGFGETPINIGELNGNSFHITLRHLDLDSVRTLTNPKKIPLLFINYYDNQRFGIPGNPKLTHLVGQKLAYLRYDEALSILKKTGTNEGKLALDFEGKAEDFFKALDIRKFLFFLNAYSSHIWNQEVANLLSDKYKLHNHIEEGVSHELAFEKSSLTALIQANDLHPFNKYKYDYQKDSIIKDTSVRPTVIQTLIESQGYEKDDLYPTHYKCNLSFYLPSGCYATMAMKHLLLQYTDIFENISV